MDLPRYGILCRLCYFFGVRVGRWIYFIQKRVLVLRICSNFIPGDIVRTADTPSNIYLYICRAIKGVELCLAVVKRRRNELRSEPFYDGADGVVLLSILVDVIILIQIM